MQEISVKRNKSMPNHGRKSLLKLTIFTDDNAHFLPPKLCISIMFDFSWDDRVTPRRKCKQWLCKIMGGEQGA